MPLPAQTAAAIAALGSRQRRQAPTVDAGAGSLRLLVVLVVLTALVVALLTVPALHAIAARFPLPG